jgi:hypothetical protein
MRVYSVKRALLWIGLQGGLLAVCSAQGVPGSPSPTGLIEENIKALPKYQIEIIAFAYHDFDPAEERFEEAPRGSLLDLLNPTLLKTHERSEPDVSAKLLGSLLNLDEDSPALIPTEPGVPAGQLEELPERPSSLERRDQNLMTADRLAPAAAVATDAQEDPIPEEVAEEPPKDRLPTGGEPWYRLLSTEELELTAAYARLELLDAYTPLVHGGWMQEGLPEELAIPFDLALLGAFNPLGTIKLHVQRFLHVTVTLRYQSERAAGGLLRRAGVGLEEIQFPARYDLKVQRRTRSGELHFFDHPAFGVLVLVKPRPKELQVPEEDLTPAA